MRAKMKNEKNDPKGNRTQWVLKKTQAGSPKITLAYLS